MFRVSYLWSLRRIRQICRILRDHHTFSVEVCLSDMSGTQTPSEKSAYRVEINPTITSTKHMDVVDRLMLRMSIITRGQSETVREIINRALYLNISERHILPIAPAKRVDGIWERKFQMDLPSGETSFLVENFRTKLVPVVESSPLAA